MPDFSHGSPAACVVGSAHLSTMSTGQATKADAELILGFVAGERESLARVDRWIQEVLGNRRFLLGADREDVAQDVRRRLLVSFRAGRFEGSSSLRTYVWRAAQHAALNHIRGRRRRPTSSLDPGWEPAAPASDPLAALALEERRELARRVLAALGDECRRLWALAVFEELPYRAVAQRLGLTEAAVKVKALRCRRKAASVYQQLKGAPSATLTPEQAP